MRDLSDLYYECHVTINPVFGDKRDKLSTLIKPYKFKLAKLAMKKTEKGTWEESQLDTFFTAHSKHYSDIQQRMVDCIRVVQEQGFVIRRYKIENTIVDSRDNDILNLINTK